MNGILKPETEETLLHAAAAVGSLSCAKLLLEVHFFNSEDSLLSVILFSRTEPAPMCGTCPVRRPRCTLPPPLRTMQSRWLAFSTNLFKGIVRTLYFYESQASAIFQSTSPSMFFLIGGSCEGGAAAEQRSPDQRRSRTRRRLGPSPKHQGRQRRGGGDPP